jgi:DNA-binding MarR family transcriptional regulator
METDDALIQIVALLTRKVFDLQTHSVKEAGFSDLSLRQVVYLDAIAHLGNPTPTELARALKISKPTASAAIDRLEEAGYIRKSQSDADRRSYHIHLTDQCHRFTQAHEDVHRRLAQALTDGLDEAEVQQVKQLMEKMIRSLSS